MAASHILIVIIAAIALTIFAERRQIQAPLLLVAVGGAVSFIPRLTQWELEPETILSLVLPPLLYSAALEFSFFSFMKRLGSILNLGVGLVVVTALVSGAVMSWMIPVLTLPAAVMLGAVVAPPDAVSAVSIGRKLGLPTRLMTVLKGESLINDAAALTLFGAAVATVTGGATFIDSDALNFLYAAGVGALIGMAMGAVVHRIRRRLTNPTLITALAIVVPFAAYTLAEEVHASGVLAVVFAGFTLGHNAASLNFAGRLQEREVWRVIDALLEDFVFAYIGLQLRFILDDALQSGFGYGELAAASGVLLALVIVVRIVWVMAMAGIDHARYPLRLAKHKAKPRRLPPSEPLSWRERIVLSWTGMRGVVTLAAAAGAPMLTADGSPLAGREAIVAIALAVAMGTLLLQGLTLPWLIRSLKINDEADKAHRAAQMTLARKIAAKAARDQLAILRGADASDEDIRLAEQQLRRARPEAMAGALDPAQPAEPTARRASILAIVGAVLTAQKAALIAERDTLKLDDEILRELLEDIDLEQAIIAQRSAQALAE